MERRAIVRRDLIGTLVTRTKAPHTTSLPLFWEIVATYGSGGGGSGVAGDVGGGARREEGFRRLSVDLQVRPDLYSDRLSPHPG